MPDKVVVYVDGSSRGNPGPAGIGIAIFEQETEPPIKEISQFIGTTTNNVAEYEAVIRALKWLVASNIKHARIKLDSELVYKQITGKYKVRKPHIAFQVKRVNNLRNKIDNLIFELIPRTANKEANHLAQRASKKIKATKRKFKQDKFFEGNL